jgi:predicted pyridoxine 5'-phosphate oxidase superfamily flavin-nucleotide-binding protein
MTSPYHAGELKVQRRAGVVAEARAVGRSVFPSVPAGAARFLERQRLVVAASVSADGRVWASLLTGGAGFIGLVDPDLVRIAARPAPGDPLRENLDARPELGLLVLDPSTRQRLRINGRGLSSDDGIFLVVEQEYGNCAKYIQRRAPLPDVEEATEAPRVSSTLSAAQAASISATDTFFIASLHPRGGADASHRGGLPGFVRVLAPGVLAFDHYPGNAMFNTLGNLVENERAGLLFVDFGAGHTLQLSGRAAVGADFSVRFEIVEVRETRNASPLRYAFVEYSPVNPPVSRASEARHLKD